MCRFVYRVPDCGWVSVGIFWSLSTILQYMLVCRACTLLLAHYMHARVEYSTLYSIYSRHGRRQSTRGQSAAEMAREGGRSCVYRVCQAERYV